MSTKRDTPPLLVEIGFCNTPGVTRWDDEPHDLIGDINRACGDMFRTTSKHMDQTLIVSPNEFKYIKQLEKDCKDGD